MHYDVAIVGGGLAGLVIAIELARAGKQVIIFEKKEYPYHKVCGEYVSNEVLPYLQSLGFDPFSYGAMPITKLKVTAAKRKPLRSVLPLGGFGISRYAMDAALANMAVRHGATLLTATRVTDIRETTEGFVITTDNSQEYTASLAIGSWGKRDVLDKKLGRPFMQEHTGFMGVKYHIQGQFPVDEISLHLFPGGYCGLTKVEGNQYNLCYLYKRGKLPFRSIEELEQKALYHNRALRDIMENATFIRNAPEAINEISFSRKETVKDGVLMCGDAAGLITPLCGNGMAMAIRSGKILSQCILTVPRKELAQVYGRRWNENFSDRLVWGQRLQDLFYNPALVNISLGLLRALPPLQGWLVKKTHGEVMR